MQELLEELGDQFDVSRDGRRILCTFLCVFRLKKHVRKTKKKCAHPLESLLWTTKCKRGVDYNRKLDELNKIYIYIYKYMCINTYLYTTAYISYVFVDIYLNIESCSVYNFMDSF